MAPSRLPAAEPGTHDWSHALRVPAAKDDGDFALAAGFARRDKDPRSISEIPEDELLDGFGE
jgi:hypothetical protein